MFDLGERADVSGRGGSDMDTEDEPDCSMLMRVRVLNRSLNASQFNVSEETKSSLKLSIASC